jgi:hypothetical protein
MKSKVNATFTVYFSSYGEKNLAASGHRCDLEPGYCLATLSYFNKEVNQAYLKTRGEITRLSCFFFLAG